MNYKALIFDMDGLMIDTERLYFQTEREIAASYGKAVDDRTLWKTMGKKPIESIRIFIDDLHLPISAEELLSVRDKMMLQKMQSDLEMMPGLAEILAEYDGILTMAIATGAIRPFVDIMLQKFGLSCYFKHIQSSEEIQNGKPNPEIYIKTVQKLGFIPSECIVLEDSANGVNAAKSAGCFVIAIPSEYTRGQDFTNSDATAKDLHEAQEYIKGQLLTN